MNWEQTQITRNQQKIMELLRRLRQAEDAAARAKQQFAAVRDAPYAGGSGMADSPKIALTGGGGIPAATVAAGVRTMGSATVTEYKADSAGVLTIASTYVAWHNGTNPVAASVWIYTNPYSTSDNQIIQLTPWEDCG
jgi:hypothetical protein